MISSFILEINSLSFIFGFSLLNIIAEKMLQQQSVSPNSPDYDTKLGDALQYLKEHPGEDAPYYRMDGDGNVYMRVINNGNMDKRPKVNDLVFLRFTRFNLSYYKDKTLPSGDGNAEDVSISESIAPPMVPRIPDMDFMSDMIMLLYWFCNR